MECKFKRFANLFAKPKPVIACIHLLPLPGAPLYEGDMASVYEQALKELEIFKHQKVDGIIIENFRDKPFFPHTVPAETIAAMAAVAREIVKSAELPVGINVLRHDAEAAIAIATAIQAHFIRTNVHTGAVVADQGILQSNAHKTMRLRHYLKSNVLVFADVDVKHAAALVPRGLANETKDLCERGLVDAVIVSGELTGAETKRDDLMTVKENSTVPVLIGSGTTVDNIEKVFDQADGFIVGSYFKQNGKANNLVEEARVQVFMSKVNKMR